MYYVHYEDVVIQRRSVHLLPQSTVVATPSDPSTSSASLEGRCWLTVLVRYKTMDRTWLVGIFVAARELQALTHLSSKLQIYNGCLLRVS